MNFDFNEILEDVEKGIAGENKGIPTGFTLTDSYTNAIQDSIYCLVGGGPGTGKTSYVDLAYVLNPYDWWVNNKDKTDKKIKVIYRSMERNTKYKIAKWTCLKLHKDYKIIIDVPTLFGWQGKKFEIDQELKEKIEGCKEYFETMLNSGVVNIYSGPENPTGIRNQSVKIALENGKEEQVTEFQKVYKKNDKDLHIVQVNDHVGKLKSEVNGGVRLTEKALLDKHSEYMGILREFYHFYVVDIVQFNRSIGSVDRMKVKEVVSPELDDFKGSGNMCENADLVTAIYNPYRHKVFDFLDYNINKFISPSGENRFRSLSIIKNTYGADDIILGLNFLGENGNFREIPTADKFNEAMYNRAKNYEL